MPRTNEGTLMRSPFAPGKSSKPLLLTTVEEFLSLLMATFDGGRRDAANDVVDDAIRLESDIVLLPPNFFNIPARLIRSLSNVSSISSSSALSLTSSDSNASSVACLLTRWWWRLSTQESSSDHRPRYLILCVTRWM